MSLPKTILVPVDIPKIISKAYDISTHSSESIAKCRECLPFMVDTGYGGQMVCAGVVSGGKVFGVRDALSVQTQGSRSI